MRKKWIEERLELLAARASPVALATYTFRLEQKEKRDLMAPVVKPQSLRATRGEAFWSVWCERGMGTTHGWAKSDTIMHRQVLGERVAFPGKPVPFWATYLLDGLATTELLPVYPLERFVRPWKAILDAVGVPQARLAEAVQLTRQSLWNEADGSVRLFGLATLVVGQFEGGWNDDA